MEAVGNFPNEFLGIDDREWTREVKISKDP